MTNEKVHIANNFGNVREQDLSITGQINNFAALAFLKESGQGSLSGGANSFVLDFGNVAQGSSQEAMLDFLNDNPLAEELFTDLLSSSLTMIMGSGCVLSGDSVNRLPGGHRQGGFDIACDTSNPGTIFEKLTFSVESINANFDEFLTPVMLTIEGIVIPPGLVPEPATVTLLASGLGVMFIFRRQRRRG